MSFVETLHSSLITYPHGFSTRTGGVSEGIFDSLNLGMNRGDDADRVKENYRRFLASCGIKETEFVCGEQVHGNNVMIVGKEQARPAYGYDSLFTADGYVTKESGVPLVIFIADCIPLLLADEQAGVVASVHCGWRSTVKNIGKNAVDAMVSLGAKKENIRACTGPAICENCFEVGGEVIEAVEDLLKGAGASLYRKTSSGKYLLDLKGVLKQNLMDNGLSEDNIEVLKDCTMCSPNRFWSHRYTKGVRGSQAAVIMKP